MCSQKRIKFSPTPDNSSASTELKVRVKARLVYHAFDLLYLDSLDLRCASLVERKRLTPASTSRATSLYSTSDRSRCAPKRTPRGCH
jgi:ATP-dependent DNA ligase